MHLYRCRAAPTHLTPAPSAASIGFCRNQAKGGRRDFVQEKSCLSTPASAVLGVGGAPRTRTRPLATPFSTHQRPARLGFPICQSYGLGPVAPLGEAGGPSRRAPGPGPTLWGGSEQTQQGSCLPRPQRPF